MSSTFYIETVPVGNEPIDYYELSVTTDFDISYPATVTSNVVESGADYTDHVRLENAVGSLNGVVTNIRNNSLNYQKPPDVLIQSLLKLRKSRQPFTLHFDDRLESLNNCVFTNLNFSVSSGMGQAYNVSISFKQILIGEAGTSVELPLQDEEVEDQHSSKVNSGEGVSEEVDTNFLAGIFYKIPFVIPIREVTLLATGILGGDE